MAKAVTPWNPSSKCIAKVLDKVDIPTVCPNCNGNVTIKHHKDVYYGGNVYGTWPWMYICDGAKCDSRVGMHPGTNIPLGTLATKQLRDARIQSKNSFTKMMKSSNMTRTEAYQALSNKMGIAVEQCHFGWFNVDQCNTARKVCDNMSTNYEMVL